MNMRGTVSSLEGSKAKIIIDGESDVTVLLAKIESVGTLRVGDTVLVAVISSFTDAVIMGVIR